jgi:phosphoribosylformylglycinamidine cyclo-ligase
MKAYAKAGVDVDLGNQVKSGLGKILSRTARPEVLGKVGGFGGLFKAVFKGYREPVLVASMDGVGTKLKIASAMGRHRGVGIDLVNHCVNDIAVVGGRPLFFLDYIGTGKLCPKVFKEILGGLTAACAQAGCALLGGETAQMPGIYHGEDYDLVGTIIGVVDRAKMIDGSKIKAGDVIIGLPSSGLHTNGYSLARKILLEDLALPLKTAVPSLGKRALGELLLVPHKSYLEELMRLEMEDVPLHGLAHITGGGLVDNLPRVIPSGLNARIDTGAWPVPRLFKFLVEKGNLNQAEAFQALNMGIGMVIITSPRDAGKVLKLVKPSYRIGEIELGKGKAITLLD